jgi:hypothetical protein
VLAQQTRLRGKKKLSRGKNQVYIGNENLVRGTKSRLQNRRNKNMFVEQLTTGEGTKIWAAKQFTTTWGTQN